MFGKKGNTFRGISFFSLLPEFQEISIPFVLTYKCQGPHGSTSAIAQDRSERWRQIYKLLSIQCVSLLVGSVADALEHNCNPAGENQLTFVVVNCVFLLLASDSGFQRAQFSSRENTVDADC